MDLSTLREAKEDRNLLAVDSSGVPKEKGWHEVVRTDSGVSFKPINEKQAQALIDQNRWHDVLHVNESAIKASEEKRPVALDAYYWVGRYPFSIGLTLLLGWLCLSLSPSPKLKLLVQASVFT